MVTPAWPPTTGTSTSVTSVPVFSAQNVFALTYVWPEHMTSARPHAILGLQAEQQKARAELFVSRMRTTSRVVTPKSLLGWYTPAFLSTSAAIGTVELTGLEMMLRIACSCQLPRCSADRTLQRHSWQHESGHSSGAKFAALPLVRAWRWPRSVP